MAARCPGSAILLGALVLAASGPGTARGADAPPRPAIAAASVAEAAAGSVALTVRVRDAVGLPLEARVSVTGSDGLPRPGTADVALMSHSAAGGYFYVAGAATLQVPIGATTIVVSRGFEYTPVRLVADIRKSTTIRVTLQRMADLSARGWFAGDAHAHARHGPIDYDLTPQLVKRVALAEGLSVLDLLDEEWEFTGAPHAVSDAGTILYFSYEHRNQIGGHLGLEGLGSGLSTGCCLSPEPPYPMLVDLAAQAHAQPGARVVLSHPHTTDDYDLLSAWPGAGLARELPVLEALGGMDAIDVASYSNEPDFDADDWYALLSAGSAVPPSAGTDAALSWYDSAPPGGWRVYAKLPGGQLDHAAWFDALVAGHSFVTSFPLVPGFSVGGSGPGEALEVGGDSLVATVDLEVLCAIGLAGVTIVADGHDVWTRPIAADPAVGAFDTTFVLRIPRPGWLLLRANGIAGHPATAAPAAVAYTNAVRVLHGGVPVRRQEAMLRWLDGLDAYEDLVLAHCEWPQDWQRDTVLARVARARRYFGAPFSTLPGSFALESPLPGDTAWAGLRWSAAADPDSGDRVTYRVRLGTDSTLADAQVVRTASTCVSDLPLVPCRTYWWSVEAEDRGGDVTLSTPRVGWFYQPGVLDVGDTPPPGPPRAWPNPSRGAVALRGMGTGVAVFDLAGRRIAWPGHGVVGRADGAAWDGLDGGRPAAPGVYLARGSGAGPTLRIVRLR
jgi:hypothetical protein